MQGTGPYLMFLLNVVEASTHGSRACVGLEHASKELSKPCHLRDRKPASAPGVHRHLRIESWGHTVGHLVHVQGRRSTADLFQRMK